MAKRSALDLIALILLIIGGINWGLVGFFNYDLVAKIFGAMSTITTIIYVLVGLSGLWTIYYLTKK
jgi:uncharacterized protein